MFEYSCKKAGAEGCGYSTTANNEADLRAQITAHAMEKHGLPGMTDTIFNYMAKNARGR
ncbi:MAG: DUF1059 domain-containing protein [Acidimicrobiales bacterium]